jgi:hypothetical protein
MNAYFLVKFIEKTLKLTPTEFFTVVAFNNEELETHFQKEDKGASDIVKKASDVLLLDTEKTPYQVIINPIMFDRNELSNIRKYEKERKKTLGKLELVK